MEVEGGHENFFEGEGFGFDGLGAEGAESGFGVGGVVGGEDAGGGGRVRLGICLRRHGFLSRHGGRRSQ